MRVNPYNWSKQSRDHLEFARRNYPTIAALVVRSGNYPAYALGAQELPQNALRRYMRERNDWYDRFGRSWERMGGVRERRFGQITSAHRFVPSRGRLQRLGAATESDVAEYSIPSEPAASAGVSPWLLVIAGGALIGGVLYARKKKARR